MNKRSEPQSLSNHKSVLACAIQIFGQLTFLKRTDRLKPQIFLCGKDKNSSANDHLFDQTKIRAFTEKSPPDARPALKPEPDARPSLPKPETDACPSVPKSEPDARPSLKPSLGRWWGGGLHWRRRIRCRWFCDK